MGTNANWKTWRDDIMFLPQPCYSELGCSGCKCHPGFMNAYDSIAGDIFAAVSELPPGPLILTGHSLGGAQATHCAIDLARRGIKADKVYTVGQPRVGNVEFAAWYASYGIEHWRVTHHRDPIPHMPWRGLGGYRQNLREAYYEDADAAAPTRICDGINSEDPKCADQFNDELTLPFLYDHWKYLGFSFAKDVIRCTLSEASDSGESFYV
jgi:pimeloyl-ACP methyl ester carboxylesterase